MPIFVKIFTYIYSPFYAPQLTEKLTTPTRHAMFSENVPLRNHSEMFSTSTRQGGLQFANMISNMVRKVREKVP